MVGRTPAVGCVRDARRCLLIVSDCPTQLRLAMARGVDGDTRAMGLLGPVGAQNR